MSMGFNLSEVAVGGNPWVKWYTVRLWFEFMQDYILVPVGLFKTTTGRALDVHVKVWSDLQHVCMNGPSQVSQKILQHDVSLAFHFIPPDCSIFCILLYNIYIYRLAYKLLFTILQTLEKQVLWYANDDDIMWFPSFAASYATLGQSSPRCLDDLEEHLLRVLSKLKPVTWVEIFWKMGGFPEMAMFSPQGHWWILVISSSICSRGHGFLHSWEIMCGLQSFLRFSVPSPLFTSNAENALRLKL